MKSFALINNSIRNEIITGTDDFHSIKTTFSSDQITTKIRELIPVAQLREVGAFFTGDDLAEKALSQISSTIGDNPKFFDPTCGVGNLLIAASNKLPINDSLDETILHWGKCLVGLDLHEEFVECTKLRLIQSAILRGATKSKKDLCELELLLPNIKTGDIYSNLDICKSTTHLLLNPPYTLQKLEEGRIWGSGKVNQAALITEDILLKLPQRAHFVAILPEVLRSGSRYSKWRMNTFENFDHSIKIEGKFDKNTDVDVFILYGAKIPKLVNVKETENKDDCLEIQLLGDFFDVSVGPLVAYRDNKKGILSPYIHPKMLTKWSIVTDFEKRRTSSKLIQPPFVVINRTSSPSDKYRATATIIKGKDPIAVENHLLVVKPKKGGLALCRTLLSKLKSIDTNNFLNQRIRCRHLTVSSVREIPFKR